MSNTWVPNDGEQKEEFDLFAPNTEDNLQEVLAKGSYKWTNKYTAVFAIALVVVTSASAGIWYGHRSASSSGLPGIAGAAGFSRSGFTRGSFGGGAAGATGGGAAAFAGGGFGGSRVSGTVVSVKGNTVTVTADSDPSSSVKAGDTVSVRVSAAGAGAPGAAPAGAPTVGATTAKKSSTSKSSTSQSTTGTTPAPGASGAPRGGGFASNPEFAACLKKQGVTIVAGQRFDRTDPKVAAALQSCFSTLGGPGGGFGGGRPPGAPAPASTTNP